MIKVLLFGTFDILHPGHLYLIKKAKEQGEVVVCLARDKTIKKVKGQLPRYNEQQRRQHLAELGVTVELGSLDDKYEVFRQVRPDIIILGYDQQLFVDGLEQVIKNEKLQVEIKRLEPKKPELFKSSKLRPILEDPDSGFLLINKPTGEPSFHTISVLRKKTKQQKIGFAGTLDPMASGLLIMGFNKATKLLDAWHLFSKEYEAEITLGAVSDTYDAEGQLTQVSNRVVDLQEIEDLLPKFRGMIEQRPPAHSAKKIGGQKAYDLARLGQEVCLRKHEVEIFNLEIIDYQYPVLKIRVLCSSGTYIRSLADDIGKELEAGGYLSKLQRTAIGPYQIEDAKSVDEIEDYHDEFIDFEEWLRRLDI